MNPTNIASSAAKCSGAMAGAARIAVQRKIFKSITSDRVADSETIQKKTSLPFARAVTERDITSAI